MGTKFGCVEHIQVHCTDTNQASMVVRLLHIPLSSAEAILESILSLLSWYCYECGVQVTMPKATNECNIALKNMRSLFSMKTWNFTAQSSSNTQ